MKKLVMLLFAAISPIWIFAAVAVQAPNQNSDEIDLEKIAKIDETGNLRYPRSINFLKAYYDSINEVISIIHEGLGDTDVYVLDKFGEIVYTDSFSSINLSTDTIPTSFAEGEYTILIDSEYFRAYGLFMIL